MDAVDAASEAVLEKAVDDLLDDDGRSAAAPGVPAARTSALPAATGLMVEPMVAIANAMIDAQGPRPTFANFAAVPASNPFDSSAAGPRHVFVTRHGARIDNGPDRDPRWLQKAAHDRIADPHLSPSGMAAAAELAAALAASAVRVAHVVSSPHVRCVQTADAVAAKLGLPICVEPGIAEVGAWAHKLLSPADLAAAFPRVDARYVPAVAREQLSPEHGDSAAAARARAAALTVRERLVGPILFVGHGASCLGLVDAFGASGYVGYTSLSRFTQQTTAARWVLDGELGDVSHLSPAHAETARQSAW